MQKLQLRFISSLSVFLLFWVQEDVISAKVGPECDDILFYSPYAKIKRKTNGGEIDSLERTGFLDLSRYLHVILCVNGPAIILSDYEDIKNATGLVSVYTNGEFQIYVHKCFRINKVSQNDLEKLHDERVPLRIKKDIPVIGKRAVGVQLIGEQGDYRKPTPVWFKNQKYGHVVRPDKIVTDGSFAVVSNTKKFCLNVSNEFNVILNSKADTDQEICVWTIQRIDEHYDRYENIFRSNRTISEYNWMDCPIDGNPPPPPPPGSSTTPAPPHIYDPFSIFGKLPSNMITPGPGPDPGHKGNDTGKKPEILVQYSVDLEICHKFPVIDKTGCATPPIPDKSCELMKQVLNIEPKKLDKELTWKNDILDLIAKIFGKVCEPFGPDMAYTVHRVFEYYLSSAHEADTSVPPLYRHDQLDMWKIVKTDLKICDKKISDQIWFDWKLRNLSGDDIFYLMRKKRSLPTQISEKLHSDETLSKSEPTFENSNKIYENDYESSEENSQLLNDYSREYHEFSSLPFYRPIEFREVTSSNPFRSKRKKRAASPPDIKLYFNQETIPIRQGNDAYNFLEYPIDIHHVNRTDNTIRKKLFFYEDTAEIDYELNVAIDIAWKIMATVAGYCSQHYAKRQSETFPRFYNLYSEDFMQPVDEEWKFPIDNEILKSILSPYNSDEGMKWLDICLEASYVDSNTETFRPPRPLVIDGEKTKLNKVANAFLDIPLEQYARFHNIKVPFVIMKNVGHKEKNRNNMGRRG